MSNNQETIKNPQGFLKTITIIHAALLIGQILFAGFAFFITNSAVINLKPNGDPLFFVVPFITVAGLIAGIFISKNKLAGMNDTNSLDEKLAIYQTTSIIRYALTEGASLFGIVTYLITGNLLFLLITGLNILYFIWLRPTKLKVEDDLNLSFEDKIAMQG